MIIKAAGLIIRKTATKPELLFVRATGKAFYIFPGGKQEAGETIGAALRREIMEELGTAPMHTEKLGVVTGHTPDGRPLQMHLFVVNLVNDPQALSEIEELLWMSREEALKRADQLTPMALDHVFPFLSEKNIW